MKEMWLVRGNFRTSVLWMETSWAEKGWGLLVFDKELDNSLKQLCLDDSTVRTVNDISRGWFESAMNSCG